MVGKTWVDEFEGVVVCGAVGGVIGGVVRGVEEYVCPERKKS